MQGEHTEHKRTCHTVEPSVDERFPRLRCQFGQLLQDDCSECAEAFGTGAEHASHTQSAPGFQVAREIEHRKMFEYGWILCSGNGAGNCQGVTLMWSLNFRAGYLDGDGLSIKGGLEDRSRPARDAVRFMREVLIHFNSQRFCPKIHIHEPRRASKVVACQR